MENVEFIGQYFDEMKEIIKNNQITKAERRFLNILLSTIQLYIKLDK